MTTGKSLISKSCAIQPGCRYRPMVFESGLEHILVRNEGNDAGASGTHMQPLLKIATTKFYPPVTCVFTVSLLPGFSGTVVLARDTFLVTFTRRQTRASTHHY